MDCSSSAPLPPLPLEVKGHVLRFCDPATLAVTSQVSLALLEMSIPILHDHIHIRGLENMEKLLCSRTSSPPSPLDAILSLQRVRAFTAVLPNEETLPLTVSVDRIPNESSIAVSDLTLGLGCEPDPRYDSLLPFFDPETVRVYGPDKWAILDLTHAPWHRLRKLELSDCTSVGYLGGASFLQDEDDSERPIPLIVVYDLAEQGWDDSLWSLILDDLGDTGWACDMFGPDKRLAEVIVRVSTEIDKEEAVKMQTECFQDMPKS